MNYASILKSIYQHGNMGNVMEALGWDAAKFDDGFHIAIEMQNRDYVKLLYSNFNRNLIVVELTLVGEELALSESS